MEPSELIPRLKKVKLFQGLTDDQLLEWISDAKEVSVPKGDFLFKEGDLGEEFFYIEQGAVEVIKNNPANGEELLITVLEQGEIVGEMAFVKGARRDASIKAVLPSRFLSISVHPRKKESAYFEIKSRLSDLLAERLRLGNKVLADRMNENLEHIRARVGLGDLVVHLLALIFIYIFVLKFISVLQINLTSTQFVSLPILSLFALSMFVLIKKSGYPLQSYGFTLKGCWKAIEEGVIFSIPLCAGTALVKWIVIQEITPFRTLQLFHHLPFADNASSSFMPFITTAILYSIFVPIQEIIFRGAIQSSLQQFLLGNHRTLQAVLISNLPFSMIHLHLSVSLSLIVYFFGVFWGWMFARQQTLVGCIVSHFLIGMWSFFIVGIEDFLVV